VRASLGGSYTYRSKTYLDVPNTEAIAQDGYGLIDLRASLGFANGIEFAVYGKNLANKIYRMNGADFFSSLGASVAWYGAPRTYGAELSWRF